MGGGQRLIESVPIDTEQGGNIGFYLVFGDGSNGGENVDPDKDVVLEYSNNDGQNWTLINTYDTEDYTRWTWINETVPATAMTPSTSFRLRQVAFDNTAGSKGADNWGIDQFTITGAAQLPRSAISDNFNNGSIDTNDWADIKGGSSRSGFTTGAHSLFFGSSSDGGGQRLAEALPVDVRGGGTIQFNLVFGTGRNGGDNAEDGDDVVLEYSSNGGSTWNLLNTYDTEAYTEWTRITETIPTVAQSANTSFRLRQVQFDASSRAKGADNWGLDNFSIVAAPLPANGDVDLVIEDVTLSTANAIFGGTTDVSWTVRNQGSDVSDSFWSDRLYLSTDDTLSEDDIFLGTVAGPLTAIAAGATYRQTTSVTLPDNAALRDGNYQVLVQADTTVSQAETDETNNVGITTISLSTLGNSFIQPDTAIASSEYSDRFQAAYTIDGSGMPDPLGPTALHALYDAGNHWISASGTDPREQYIDWGFSTAQTLDAIYLWNHPSPVGPIADPGYDVTLFDLTLFDAANNILLSLDDVAMQPDTAAAQTFSFGQTIANVSRVRFDIEDVQSSTTFTGLAEVGFNTV